MAAAAPAAGTLTAPDGETIAYRRRAGRGPTLVWLPGLGSDMEGQKALAVDAFAAAHGRPVLRFDYSGHGASSGAFEEGVVGRWLEDALLVVDALTDGPLVLVGSSMGAWIAAHLARRRPGRVAALLLIAPALDFTDRLLEPSLSEAARAALGAEGRWVRPSPYDPSGMVITRALLEDGRRLSLLGGPIAFAGPVRILQGGADRDVPVHHALETARAFGPGDVVMELVGDADHRISRPQDLARLERMLHELLRGLEGDP